MKFFFIFLFFFYNIHTTAQVNRKFNKKPPARGKMENRANNPNTRSDTKNNFISEFKKISAEFDSTDFEFAILISDNAGLFAAKNKPETRARYLKMAGLITSALNNTNLSDEENANLNLEIARTAYALGRFVFAEKRFKSAQGWFEKGNLKNDIGYLKSVAGQGLLYTSMNRYSQAEIFTLQALQILNSGFDENDLTFASFYNNNAVLHFNLGRYNESEKDFDKAITVIKTGQQQVTMPYAIILNNQAMLYQSLGRYSQAEKNLLLAIDIAGKSEESKAKNHLKFYSNLALLYQQMNRLDEAEKTYRILENKYERGKTEFANLLNNLAILLLVMNKHDRIEDILKNAAAIYKTNMGEYTVAYAKVISDLGNFYRYKNRLTDALPLLEKVLEIREQLLGTNHPLYVQSLEDAAILHWKIKNPEKAYSMYTIVMEKTIEFINNYFPPMSDAEKTKYWEILLPRFQRYFNFTLNIAAENKQALVQLFEYRMAIKGLLLNSARYVNESILSSGNDKLVNEYRAWLNQKEELAAFYVYSKEELKEQNINLDSLLVVVNTSEKKLSENSKAFKQFYFTGKAGYQDIINSLKNDEALIEIIRLRHFDQFFSDSVFYAGLVIKKDQVKPGIVLLPEGAAMENKFSKKYQDAIKQRKNDDSSWINYWLPFDKELAGIKKIYVSLDGVYNQVNLNTLKKPGGDYLINLYNILLLGNAKDILAVKDKTTTPAIKKATLFGYPDFGSDRIPELPGTQIEVEEIDKLLTGSGYHVNVFLQKLATETNLKKSKEISILHIATHGYFLQDVSKVFWPIGVHLDNAKDNILLRSGLMLAGADNKSDAGLDSSNNGIITSFEAMNLNLKGTKLVVLSACETGLGEVRAGEGVYGLQRAFLVAGAEALIMSLWKVDDAATHQLMNSFYTNWIKTGDMQYAFKQAQQLLMTKYKDPFYWGAFVMMED